MAVSVVEIAVGSAMLLTFEILNNISGSVGQLGFIGKFLFLPLQVGVTLLFLQWATSTQQIFGESGQQAVNQEEKASKEPAAKKEAEEPQETPKAQKEAKKPAAKKSGEKLAAKKSGEKLAAKESGEKLAAKKSGEKVAAKESGEKLAAKKSGEKLAANKSGGKPAAKKSAEKLQEPAKDKKGGGKGQEGKKSATPKKETSTYLDPNVGPFQNVAN